MKLLQNNQKQWNPGDREQIKDIFISSVFPNKVAVAFEGELLKVLARN